MNSFEERLKRIQQTNHGPEAPAAAPAPAPVKRGPSRLAWAVLLLGTAMMGGAVGTMALMGPQGMQPLLAAIAGTEPTAQVTEVTPAEAEAPVLAEVALEAADAPRPEPRPVAAADDEHEGDRAASDPARLQQATFPSTSGFLYRHPAAATPTGRGDAAAIVAQYSNPHLAPGFGGVEILSAPEQCLFRPIREGETPYLVQMETAFPNAPVLALQKSAIAEEVQKMVEEVLTPGRRNFTMGDYTAVGQVALANVYVTDTSAPLYLILGVGGRVANPPPAVIWNIHIAEGVEIAHLTLDGRHGLGVVLPDGADIPMTLASTGVVENAENCLPQMARKPDLGWKGMRRLSRVPDDAMAQQHIDSANDLNLRYRIALEALTGVRQEVEAASPYAADHLLLGPVPEEPLPFQHPAEHTLRITAFDHLEFGPRDVIAQRVLDLHAEVVAAAIGPDWSAALAPQEAVQ